MRSIRDGARAAGSVARRLAQARFVYPGRTEQAREAEAVRELFSGENTTAQIAWHEERGCFVDRMGRAVPVRDASEPDVRHGYPDGRSTGRGMFGPDERDADMLRDVIVHGNDTGRLRAHERGGKFAVITTPAGRPDPMADPDGMPLMRSADVDRERGA